MYIGLPTKNGQKTRQLRGQRRVPRAVQRRWPCHATRCKQGGSHAHCNAAPARSAAPDRRGPARARVCACTRRGRPGPATPPSAPSGAAASSRGTVLLRLLKRAGARKVGATPPHTPASKDEETASTWPSRLSRDQSRRRPCAPTPSPPLPQASLQDTCSCPQTPCPRPPGVAGVVWLPRQTSLLSQGQLGWALSSSRVEPEQG